MPRRRELRPMRRVHLPMRLRFLLVLLCLLGVPAAGHADPASSESRIFLSWHAPYGTPGATDLLQFTPGDTTREDTLYLVAEPGTDSKTTYGYKATLYFRTVGNDTLSPYWRMGESSDMGKLVKTHMQREDTLGLSPIGPQVFSAPNLKVECNWDPKLALPTAWPRGNAISLFRCDWTRYSCRVRIGFVVPSDHLFTVEYGKRYTVGRVILRRPAADVPNAAQPICVEWGIMSTTYGTDDDRETVRGDRWVAINSRDACAEHIRTVTPPAWKPKAVPQPH